MADTPFQPLSGNWRTVKNKAERYADIADAIARSVATLEAIKDADKGKSEAIAQLKDGAENVARDIGKAQQRYELTADVLLVYSGALNEADGDADAAISTLATAQSEASTASWNLQNANEAAEEAGADPVASQLAIDTRQDTYDDAVLAVQNAQQAWYDARDKKVTAAETAEAGIDDVVNGEVGNQLNDSWWDDIGNVLDVIKLICQIAGVLAIFLSWVPILGQILVVLALVGALITLVDSIVKLTRGEGSWADVAFAVVGVALSLIGGKALSWLGKLTKFKGFSTVAAGTKFKPYGFKNMTGISKANFPGQFNQIKGMSGFMNEVVKKTFEVKGLAAFLKNPVGLNTIDAAMDLSKLGPAAKLGLAALDVQVVTSKIEKILDLGSTLTSSPAGPTINPQGLIIEGLQGGANAVEDAIGDLVTR